MLVATLHLLRAVAFPISDGIIPVNSLLAAQKLLRAGIMPMLDGIEPWKELSDSRTIASFSFSKISSGKLPVISFPKRSKKKRFFNFEMVSGIVPSTLLL